ncbi:MAG: SMC-Scp complex subunit ScpB [Sumerlaeia bacterium]
MPDKQPISSNQDSDLAKESSASNDAALLDLKDSTADKEDETLLPQPLPEELEAVLEALLFATTTPLSVARLSELTSGVDKDEILGALNGLRETYANSQRGLMLNEVAGGFQLATKAEYADWILALLKHRRKNPLSPALIETLSIVAYKQPIVKAEIEAIRGVDSGGVLRSLLDAGLVEVVGYKEVLGRPSLYGTTETFLKTFGLKNLEDLPSLSQMKELFKAPMKKTAEGNQAPEDSEANPSPPDPEISAQHAADFKQTTEINPTSE